MLSCGRKGSTSSESVRRNLTMFIPLSIDVYNYITSLLRRHLFSSIFFFLGKEVKKKQTRSSSLFLKVYPDHGLSERKRRVTLLFFSIAYQQYVCVCLCVWERKDNYLIARALHDKYFVHKFTHTHKSMDFAIILS